MPRMEGGTREGGKARWHSNAVATRQEFRSRSTFTLTVPILTNPSPDASISTSPSTASVPLRTLARRSLSSSFQKTLAYDAHPEDLRLHSLHLRSSPLTPFASAPRVPPRTDRFRPFPVTFGTLRGGQLRVTRTGASGGWLGYPCRQRRTLGRHIERLSLMYILSSMKYTIFPLSHRAKAFGVG